ncbi:MAG: hypothetical protein ACKO9I_07790 [Sphaerospermopsis kisseleviana]
MGIGHWVISLPQSPVTSPQSPTLATLGNFSLISNQRYSHF